MRHVRHICNGGVVPRVKGCIFLFVMAAVFLVAPVSSGTELLSENWETGIIDPAEWLVWEENPSQPDPQVVLGEGLAGSYGLNVGGATTYFTRLYSWQTFDLSQAPLEFSCWLRATQSLTSGQVVGFGISSGTASDVEPGGAQPPMLTYVVINACLPTGDPTHNTLNYGVIDEHVRTEWDSSESGEFHLYSMTVNSDGTVTFGKDGVEQYTSATVLDISTLTAQSLVLYGIASGTPQNVDDVSVDVLAQEVSALVDIDPDTLNLKSKGRYITCYITLPDGYDVSMIDTSTIAITKIGGDNMVPPMPIDSSFTPQVGDRDEDGIPDLTVKFDRQALIALPLLVSDHSITVEGDVASGTHFAGSDSIRAIRRGN